MWGYNDPEIIIFPPRRGQHMNAYDVIMMAAAIIQVAVNIVFLCWKVAEERKNKKTEKN